MTRHLIKLFPRALTGGLLLAGALPLSAASFVAWPYQQDIPVDRSGLVRVALPVATLNAARPGLEDLRLTDAQGREVPFLIQQSRPVPQTLHPAQSFQSTLTGQTTVLRIESGSGSPLTGILLETPARQFIKAVRVEGSPDGEHWQKIAEGVPLFRHAGGPSGLEIPLPPGEWSTLRLTVDDQRSAPVPFTGARLRAAARANPATEPVAVSITARDEGPEETRLTLDLGAAHLLLAGLEVETRDPLFTRDVLLAALQVAEDGVREQTLAEGTVLRFGGNGQPEVAQTTLTVERATSSRELVLRIRNEDSPPLAIQGIRAWRRPVNLVFFAREPGSYRLFLGHPLCDAPRYDIAVLSHQLNTGGAQVVETQVGALTANPEYQTPETLPDVSSVGAPLDVRPWKYRKPVRLVHAGVQALELDGEVLARAQNGLGDLRLVEGESQVPFLLEHTSLTRAIQPEVSRVEDPKRPTVSRWALKLPEANLPLPRLVCTSSTPLFERRARLWEEVSGERGTRRIRELGSASWSRAPGRNPRWLELTLSSRPRTDTLWLEIDNGDNPPIQLDAFQLFHPVTRMVFKAGAADAPALYYGHASVNAPHYDLRLVGRQLLAAPKFTAGLGAQEVLQVASWRDGPPLRGLKAVLFWGALAIVVITLLIVIARLLPKAETDAPTR